MGRYGKCHRIDPKERNGRRVQRHANNRKFGPSLFQFSCKNREFSFLNESEMGQC